MFHVEFDPSRAILWAGLTNQLGFAHFVEAALITM